MQNVLDEIMAERARQDKKWGEQNHPDGTSHKHYCERLLRARKSKRLATGNGSVSFAHILAEEFFEVMTEPDPTWLRVELVQLAAVAVQWVQAIDRRGNKQTAPTGAGVE
jgi:hypothetical protein